MKTFRRPLTLGLFAVSLLALVWGYQLMFLDHAPTAFSAPEEDIAYAWYVPLFSLYVLWRERRQLVASLGAPSLWGLFFALPFFAAGFLGIRGHQLRLEIVGFAGLLVALTWTFWGVRAACRVAFPAAFLLFCMPLASFLGVVTVPLRLFAVSVSHVILNGLGADVVRQGTMLAAADGSFSIDVAAPCSGLRSLFAMMALAAGYGYFAQPTWPRRLLLFALAVPIAIIGNVARILSIALVGTYCSADFAIGFYHDYSGYVVFIIAIALMLMTSEIISRGAERCAKR